MHGIILPNDRWDREMKLTKDNFEDREDLDSYTSIDPWAAGDRIMIPCPNGDKTTRDLGDRSVHILIPAEYAEQVLKTVTML